MLGYGLALEHLPCESPSSIPSTYKVYIKSRRFSLSLSLSLSLFGVGDGTQSLTNIHKYY